MPNDKMEKEIKKRGGATKFRTIHPKGRPDVYLHVAVVKKPGKEGGKTVVGKVHHVEENLVDNYLNMLFEEADVEEQGNPYSQLGYTGHSKGHERDTRVLRKYVQSTTDRGASPNQAIASAVGKMSAIRKARQKGVIEDVEEE